LPIGPGKNISLIAQILQVTSADGVSKPLNEPMVISIPPHLFIVVKDDVEITKEEPVLVLSDLS
jgi:hypothetical protein